VEWSSTIGDALLGFAGDAARGVRAKAINILQRCTFNEDADAMRLEEYLTRKASDLRQGVLSILLNQPDQITLSSAERLLKSRNAMQRNAGLELLSQLSQAKRAMECCQTLAQDYRVSHAKLDAKEQAILLDTLFAAEKKTATLDDALGLIDQAERTRPVQPKTQKVTLVTPNAATCLRDLDRLIDQHRETSVTLKDWRGEREQLLGTLGWWFPQPDPKLTPAEDAGRLPLREVWEAWWTNRPKSLRDSDGFELLRIGAAYELTRHSHSMNHTPTWLTGLVDKLCLPLSKQVEYGFTVAHIIHWLLKLHPLQGAPDFLLDAIEHTCTLVPQEEIRRAVDENKNEDKDWRLQLELWCWLHFTNIYRELAPSVWQDAHILRLWHLLHWIDEPYPGVRRHRPNLNVALEAHRLGGATDADVIDQLIGPRPQQRYGGGFDDLHKLTSRKPSELFVKYPRLRELVDHCRNRVVEVELERGDMPTAASNAATSLACVWGVDTLVKLLQITGHEGLSRKDSWYGAGSKAEALSHLVHVSFPDAGDTPDAFALKAQEAHIPPQHLVELAVFAPQWAEYVERALGWPQLADTVWWVYAHTKDTHWSVGNDIREAWTAQVSARQSAALTFWKAPWTWRGSTARTRHWGTNAGSRSTKPPSSPPAASAMPARSCSLMPCWATWTSKRWPTASQPSATRMPCVPWA
jgi:hypothetical protein